jgi:hypothetical protein
MRKGSEGRATGSEYDKKSSKGNLMYESAIEGPYSISL